MRGYKIGKENIKVDDENPTFNEVCAYAPSINVWSRYNEVETLVRPEKPPRDFGFFRQEKGRGEMNDPHVFLTQLHEEHYYEIISLWLHHRSAMPAYIKVGDWLLRAELEGVRANGRTYTRLLPLKYSSS